MKKICAVIAARSGSIRVKNKNIRKFGESSLLVRKIKQLKKIKEIDEIYVNSNSYKILSIAKKYGTKTILRDRKYATNTISINKVYTNVVREVPSKHILFIHITSPFVKTTSIRNGIKKYLSLPQKKYDCLASVTQFKKFLWNVNKPLNYMPNKMPRSQDLPPLYYLNFAFNIIKKSNLIRNENIIGKKIFPYFLTEIESFDIDNNEEFELASYLSTKIKL